MIYCWQKLVVGPEQLASMIETDAGSVDQAMGFAQGSNRIAGELVAFERDDIDAARPRRVPLGEHVRWNIVQHAAEPTRKAVAANRAEMMHGNTARDCGVVLHVNMPTQECGVGHDHAAADAAIVGNVASGHDETAVAERREAILFFAPPIDRHPFADDVAIANQHFGIGTLIADILRIATNDGPWKNGVFLADGDGSLQRDAAEKFRSPSDFDLGADDAKRSDGYIVG